MGQPGDPAAVVDLDGAVLGYEALRVCDASVMPDLPKANTHLTTVAIAERLAVRLRSRPAGSPTWARAERGGTAPPDGRS